MPPWSAYSTAVYGTIVPVIHRAGTNLPVDRQIGAPIGGRYTRSLHAMAARFDTEYIHLHANVAHQAKANGDRRKATDAGEPERVSSWLCDLAESQPLARSTVHLTASSRSAKSGESPSPSGLPASTRCRTRRNGHRRRWRRCGLLSPLTTCLFTLTAGIRVRARLVHTGRWDDQLLDGYTENPSEGAQVPLRWLVDPPLPSRHGALSDAQARGDRGQGEGARRGLGSLHPDLPQSGHAHRLPISTGELRSTVPGLKLSARTFELNTQVVGHPPGGAAQSS